MDLEETIKTIQSTENNAYKSGQKNMLEKVLEITRQWERGLYSNEEYKKILSDYSKEFYGK